MVFLPEKPSSEPLFRGRAPHGVACHRNWREREQDKFLIL